VSLFHLVPWIALNTSEARALKRWEFLPPAYGRYEYYIARWHLTHNEREQARQWLWKAVAANPGHGEAHYYLALYAVDEGRFDEAVRHLQVATRARPDLTKYRLALVDALVLDSHPESAVAELESLVRSDSTEARYWACYGVVLTGLGRIPDARIALGRARALAPRDSTYARLLARVADRDAYARAVRDDWDALVVR
jgi:tetratricopeptide (TPR) repeat protein